MKNPGVFLNGMLINNLNNMVGFGSDKSAELKQYVIQGYLAQWYLMGSYPFSPLLM